MKALDHISRYMHCVFVSPLIALVYVSYFGWRGFNYTPYLAMSSIRCVLAYHLDSLGHVLINGVYSISGSVSIGSQILMCTLYISLPQGCRW